MSYIGVTQDLSPTGATPVQGFYKIIQTLAPASVPANSTAEQLFTVPGVALNDSIDINKNSHQFGLGILNVVVRAANQLAITYSNTSGGAIVPTAEQYIIGGMR